MKMIKLDPRLKAFISLSVLAYLFYLVDWSILEKLDWNFSWVFLGTLAAYLMLFVGISLRWYVLLKLNAVSSRLPRLYGFYLVGSMYNILLPGAIGGDVVRIGLAANQFDVSLKRSAFVVLLERMFGIFALACMLVIGTAVLGDEVLQRLGCDCDSKWLLLGLLFVFAGARYVLNKKITVSWRHFFLLIFLSALGQATDILGAYIFLQYLGQPVPLEVLLLVMPLVFIVTILPISLGGIGVREGAMSGLLVFFGVDVSVAVFAAVLLYMLRIALAFIGVAVQQLWVGKPPEVAANQ